MKPLVTMRAALSDPEMLGAAMKGPSWDGWRALLIAAVGEELTDDERVIFKSFTGRDRESGQMIDTWLCVAGRRSGKTTAMAALTVYLACLCDWSDDLSLGERGTALYLAPTTEQAGRAFRYAATFIEHSPLMKKLVVNQTQDRIELSNQIDIEISAANWRHVRGGTAICVVLDESAFFRSEAESSNRDEDIVTAIRPSLVTTNGPLCLISSPATDQGVVYQIQKRHYGAGGDPLILVVQADSKALNPRLDQARIDREYDLDAEGSQAEWGGQFRMPVSQYLPRALIEKAIEKGLTGRQPLPGVTYVAFVDVASGTGRDSFTCCIAHKSRDRDRDLIMIDWLYEWKPPFDPIDVVGALASQLETWRIHEVTGDEYGAGITKSLFARVRIAYLNSPATASEIYLHTLPAWTSGSVAMLDQPRAVDQFVNLTRKVGEAGKESVVHRRGAHDDVANVVAGAIYRLTPVERDSGMIPGGAGEIWGVVRSARYVPGVSGNDTDDAYAYSQGRGGYRGSNNGNGGVVR